MLSQANILPTTPMGANLIGGGATFRAWAPRATAVYVNGTFGGTPMTGQTNALLMTKDVNGYWTGFIPNGRRRPLSFLARRGPRNGHGQAVPDLQLLDPLRHSLPVARCSVCDPPIFPT